MDLFPSPTFTPLPSVEPLGPFRDGNWDDPFDELETAPPAGASAVADPFTPEPVSGEAKVTFEPGIIVANGSNISPTVGGGSTMSTVPRPELTITTSGAIYLEATLDGGGEVTDVDTKNAASTPADTSTLKRLEIATVTLSSGEVTVTSRPVRESRNFFVCNETVLWLQ